jgi:hypothetical protein
VEGSGRGFRSANPAHRRRRGVALADEVGEGALVDAAGAPLGDRAGCVLGDEGVEQVPAAPDRVELRVRNGLQESTCLEFLKGLAQLRLRIHDDRSVPGNWLLKGFS